MSTRTRYGAFIDGRETSFDEEFDVRNPADGSVVATVAEGGSAGIDAALRAAASATDAWQAVDPDERERILADVADALREHVEPLAETETAEMGRPISQSRALVSDAIGYVDYYAGVPTKIEGEMIPVPGERFDYTRHEPLGISAQVVPWNAPLLLGLRGIAPALACGNVVVAKPSPEAPGSLLHLAEIACDAGLPDGVLNVVAGHGKETGEPLVSDPRIGHLTFTGSVPTGIHVGKLAMENVRPTALELGGKSPSIVFDDANLEAALEDTIAVFANSGQICFATTRVFVEESVYDEFVGTFADRVAELSVGPGSEDPDVGPLVSADALEDVAETVRAARANGATILAGGERLERDGNFYAPTVVTGVDDDAPLSCDEVFGPVVAVYAFSSEEEVVERANDTDYGLYGTVWTGDVGRAHRVAGELEAGTVTINEYPAVFPQAPFGGYKQSGLGRQKGMQAIDHFTQLKNVVVSTEQRSGRDAQ